MSLILQGSTSGSITLQEPAIAGTNTLSLPAETGTLITTASSGKIIPKAGLPTGSVLQVVQGTLAGNTATTSTSLVSTGLTASITPNFSTSKILICVSITGFYSTVANTAGKTTIYRNSTNIAPSGSGANQTLSETFGSAGQTLSNATYLYLDSPATTSATTYTIYFASNNGNNVQFNPNGQTSSIQLLEIAA